MANTEAKWQNVNPETLPASALGLYNQYKDQYRKAAALREEFEKHMNELAQLPIGSRLAFGYKFGKLSMAVVEDDRKPSKSTGAASLADFLAQQASSGRRA